MILGIGTDIIEINRIARSFDRFGERFLQRLFTPLEQAYCDKKPVLRWARYAKRFAAKEAFLKALGTGRAKGIAWKDVEVSNAESGQPSLIIRGRGLEVLMEVVGARVPGATVHLHLSLSDTKDHAQAMVVIEGLMDGTR